MGTAPVGEMEVPVGVRTIIVRHPDYPERRATMDIKRDQTSEITLPLGNTPDTQKPAMPKLAPLSAAPAPRIR